ncbi:MAG: glycoside hydrolase family 88 protein [Anaerolineae bacterium]|nr:glycoside hydrolase family 88 protein [Anaerolineae bacterium]
MSGLEKLHRFTADPKYLNYIIKFVDQHVTADGDIHDFKGDSLDDIMAGTVIVAAYEMTGQERYHLAADKIREAFEEYPCNSDGGFWHARSLPHEMWIDGVFMGQMFLTRYGIVVGDQAYCFDQATRQIFTLASHCRQGGTGLFLHAYDEARNAAWADPVTGLSPEVWSEGLGCIGSTIAYGIDPCPGQANPSSRAHTTAWVQSHKIRFEYCSILVLLGQIFSLTRI